MRKFAILAATLALLTPDGAEGGTSPAATPPAPESKTSDELANTPVAAGANDADADLRIEITNLRQQVRLLTRENAELRATNETLNGALNAGVAKYGKELVTMIVERRKAGLSAEQAEECALRQIAHDKEQAELAAAEEKRKAAEAKAAKQRQS